MDAEVVEVEGQEAQSDHSAVHYHATALTPPHCVVFVHAMAATPSGRILFVENLEWERLLGGLCLATSPSSALQGPWSPFVRNLRNF